MEPSPALASVICLHVLVPFPLVECELHERELASFVAKPVQLPVGGKYLLKELGTISES